MSGAKIYLAAYLGAGLALGGLDAVWLSQTSANLYRPLLGALLAPGFRVLPAALFYLIYLAGVVYFGVRPGLQRGSWRISTMNGGLFGFCCYATYDLTNQATLVRWSTSITLLDLAWGVFLTSTGATAGYWAARLAGRALPF